MKKVHPECGEECDPVTDEHNNPFRKSGLGTAFFCDHCKIHWWDGIRKKQKPILEEKPAPEN